MDDTCTVFVAGLEERVTEELLLELFTQAGPVVDVKIPKDSTSGKIRTFGFIKFVHEESVPYASRLLDGTYLYHKRITCKPQSSGSRSEPNSPSSSPIGNRSPYHPQEDTDGYRAYQPSSRGYMPNGAAMNIASGDMPRHAMHTLQKQMFDHHHSRRGSYTPSPPRHHPHDDMHYRRNSMPGRYEQRTFLPTDHWRGHHPYRR